MEDNKKTDIITEEIYASLSDEQKKKAKNCKTLDEFIAFAKKEDIELPDEVLNDISGGVQAGLITEGGSGEFGPKKTENPQPKRKTWL